MFQFLKRWWAYLAASGNEKFNEHADPKVQLSQAIAEERKRHGRLKYSAATIIGQAKRAENQLDTCLDRLDHNNALVRKALLMEAEKRAAGDNAKADEYKRAAETLTDEIVTLEAQVNDFREAFRAASIAATDAKAQVATSEKNLEKLAREQKKLLTKLERAKMQEAVNDSVESLNENVGGTIPTIKEVEDKIETRLANAQGMSELNGESSKGNDARVQLEADLGEISTQERMDKIRAELGITSTVVDTTGHAGDSKSLGEGTEDTVVAQIRENLTQPAQQPQTARG